jgi:hypothetical protein
MGGAVGPETVTAVPVRAWAGRSRVYLAGGLLASVASVFGLMFGGGGHALHPPWLWRQLAFLGGNWLLTTPLLLLRQHAAAVGAEPLPPGALEDTGDAAAWVLTSTFAISGGWLMGSKGVLLTLWCVPLVVGHLLLRHDERRLGGTLWIRKHAWFGPARAFRTPAPRGKLGSGQGSGRG